MRNLRYKQNGHAALLFVLIFGALVAALALQINTAQALMAKARLADATDVAVLAVSAQNSPNTQLNKQLAKKYIESYLPDADVTINTVTRTNCFSSSNSNTNTCERSHRYTQYDINSTISNHFLFNLNNESDTFSVTQASAAKRLQGDSIDLVFVIDYSGSMDERLAGERKFIQVRNIVNEVLDELNKYQGIQTLTNRVSVIPFSEFTSSVGAASPTLCSSLHQRILPFVDELYYDRLAYSTQFNTYSYQFNAAQTVNNWATNRAIDTEMACDSGIYGFSNGVSRRYFGGTNSLHQALPFHNISFTDDFDLVKREVATFRPRGATSIYQGIIKGAQQINALPSPNPRQLLLLLSDGDDTKGAYSRLGLTTVPTADLVNHNLCGKIKSDLSGRSTNDGRLSTFNMALIGFGHNAHSQTMKRCFDEKNIYDASNSQQLLDIILNLITEEIGHLS
ncbi:TPA: VWA domain-containing protein [Vibrio vulnificus]|nr:VWA domain-containing protein [Vibrio vulnificus]HDY8012860.1 VWA domain-containing protein [Vibrio vulnificus]